MCITAINIYPPSYWFKSVSSQTFFLLKWAFVMRSSMKGNEYTEWHLVFVTATGYKHGYAWRIRVPDKWKKIKHGSLRIHSRRNKHFRAKNSVVWGRMYVEKFICGKEMNSLWTTKWRTCLYVYSKVEQQNTTMISFK